jgi:hypothetical protein
MDKPIDGTDGKLGRGFMTADKLEEIDIGDGYKPRLTFVSTNLDSDFREELIKLLKEYKDCFARDYSEMPGLYRSIVPVYKKNGKMRVCIDFRDVNRATPMDGYPMPVADLLVNAAAGHKVNSFIDGNAGYNQIFMAVEDVAKTAFRCPGHIGLF